MRRAEERLSASVMISNSIRWSLVGNDVDCRMKASEPRTFSWISTKISMSAKRRTTPLVRETPSPSAIACASAGLELPAISLMEPFLADIDASPRALLDTTFSISLLTLESGGFRWARRYQGQSVAGNPVRGFSRAKMGRKSPELDARRALKPDVPTRRFAGEGNAVVIPIRCLQA